MPEMRAIFASKTLVWTVFDRLRVRRHKQSMKGWNSPSAGPRRLDNPDSIAKRKLPGG